MNTHLNNDLNKYDCLNGREIFGAFCCTKLNPWVWNHPNFIILAFFSFHPLDFIEIYPKSQNQFHGSFKMSWNSNVKFILTFCKWQ